MMLDISPRNVANLLFKRRVAATVFAAAVLLLGLAYLAVGPWMYQSSATIVVKIDQQTLADPQLQQASSSSSEAQGKTNEDLAKDIVNTHVDMLESEDVARATLEQLGIAYVYPPIGNHAPWFFGTAMDIAAHKLTKDITVKVDTDTNTLLVTLSNSNPAVAQKTLQTMIGVFMQKQAEIMRDPQLDFMKKQLDDAHDKLDTAQKAYVDYKRQSGVTSVDDERSLLLNQRDDIEESISDERAKVASLTASRDQLLRSMHDTPAGVDLTNENDKEMSQLDNARDRLAKAEERYLEATQAYALDNSMVVDARGAVELARSQFNDIANASTTRVRSGVNPVYQSLETQLKQTEASLAAEQASVDQWVAAQKSVQARLDHIDEVDGGASKLKDQVDLAQDDYKAYLSRAEEARINEELNANQITTLGVVQAPDLPYEPHPKLILILAIVVAMALFGSIALCFGLETLDRTIGPPDQVEPRTGLPLLVTLNQLDRRESA